MDFVIFQENGSDLATEDEQGNHQRTNSQMDSVTFEENGTDLVIQDEQVNNQRIDSQMGKYRIFLIVYKHDAYNNNHCLLNYRLRHLQRKRLRDLVIQDEEVNNQRIDSQMDSVIFKENCSDLVIQDEEVNNQPIDSQIDSVIFKENCSDLVIQDEEVNNQPIDSQIDSVIFKENCSDLVIQDEEVNNQPIDSQIDSVIFKENCSDLVIQDEEVNNQPIDSQIDSVIFKENCSDLVIQDEEVNNQPIDSQIDSVIFKENCSDLVIQDEEVNNQPIDSQIAEQTLYDDAKCQTSKKLSNNSPRKVKQRKIIDRQRKRLKRLKQQALNNKQKRRPRDLQKDKAIKILRKFLPEKIIKFIDMQIDLHHKNPNGRRYNEETKRFALSLYHVSGKVYRMVAKFFSLPSKRSLMRWVSGLPRCPGLTKEAMNVIAEKVSMGVKLMDENAKICTISMDEMSLKVNLAYDSCKDEIIGLKDFGDGEKGDSDKVKEKLFEAIDKVTAIGLTVTAIISDLGSNFIKLARELNITPEKPWFMHNGVRIIYIFDPPHLIKAVRNNMMNYEFHFEQKVARWNDVEALYAHDKTLSIRCCPKLTEDHIHPNGFKKMKVKLATQVLSHTVAAAMLMYVSIGTLPPSATGTSELLSKFDKVFDCLNSSSFKAGKILNRPITSTSSHLQFMKEMIPFIASIRVINPQNKKDVTNTLKCLRRLQIILEFFWFHATTRGQFR
ncbi:Transposable element P transposase [Paramuricea clavata]|uniref:Transposable element P transposase n=1 Tax=Paramuricea clavata TaxID=317549 RepID=A0A7D9DB77_PARCT|nr:Transposable element P transposase [Paramuricea clavata]